MLSLLWNIIELAEGQISVSLIVKCFIVMCLLYVMYSVAINWFEFEVEMGH